MARAMIQTRMIGHSLASRLRDGRDFAGRVAKLFGALARMTPGGVAASVLVFVLSQILLLTALILPWKLLIFLSSGHFPATLPHVLARYAPRDLVVLLSAASVLAFLVHLLFDAAFGALARRGARHILKRHRKTGLFNNEQRIAIGVYRHMMRVAAGTVACALVMLALGWLHPLMLFALMACFGAGLAGIVVWRGLSLDPERQPAAGTLGKLWLGGGFLFLMGWIVADYWRGHLPPLTVAFVSLALGRQALMFAAQITQSLMVLEKQRSRVGALFLADTPWVPRSRPADDFQTLFAPERREDWVREALADCGERDALVAGTELRMAEGGRLAYLTVTIGGDGRTAFLIKLFHRSLDVLVQHEMEILSIAASGWPAPLLFDRNRVEQHHCLIFSWDRGSCWLDRPQRAAQLSRLCTRLVDCSLPEDLVQRYDRSQPHLIRRLSTVDWDGLRAMAASGEILEHCASVEAHWPNLLLQVGALPRQLVLPGLAGRMMASGQDGAMPVICNWARWRWEPVGAGWSTTPAGRKDLQSAFTAYNGARGDLAQVDGETAYRAALLYEMERCLSKSSFSAALMAVERLHASMAEHGVAADIPTAAMRRDNVVAIRDMKGRRSW